MFIHKSVKVTNMLRLLARKHVIPKIKSTTRQSFKTLTESSFQVNWNPLPKHLIDRTKCEVMEFKEDLGKYHIQIPDHSKVGEQILHTCDVLSIKLPCGPHLSFPGQEYKKCMKQIFTSYFYIV